MAQKTKIGGQAVIEGVMMKSPQGYAVVVRDDTGAIHRLKKHYKSITTRWKLFRVPIIRGMGVLIETLVIGLKTLQFSAEKAIADEKAKTSKKNKEKSDRFYIVSSMLLAFALGIGLFIYLPWLLANWLKSLFPLLENYMLLNLVDGAIRLVFFLLYLFIISRMKDIKRVFQYHGAEHKTIFAYEAGKELSVENARAFGTRHPRCGTSFLMIVLILSIILFSLLKGIDSILLNALMRMALVPLIAGLAYEIIMLSDKLTGPVYRAIVYPGVALQRITTSEPDDDQLETAIMALKEVLDLEEGAHVPQTAGTD